jgi:hypothetical protein
MIASWVDSEFATLDLKHAKRNERAKLILSQFSAIGESSPVAAKGKTTAALDGLYRFVRNANIKPSAVLEPHFQSSIARTTGYSRVALVQDTTEVDLTKPKRQVEQAGPLSSSLRFGFYLHPLVAYNTSGVSLGLVACHHWTRNSLDTESTPEEKKKKRVSLPIEEKESYRWLEMIRRGKEIAVKNPATEYVGVSDSESDVLEVLSEAVARPENYHLLVRACQNRAILDYEITYSDEQPAHGSASAKNIQEALDQSPVRLCSKVKVRSREAKTGVEKRARRVARSERTANLEIRAVAVTLRVRFAASSTELQESEERTIKLNVVQAREVSPPPGEEPVGWILLTTLPIETDAQLAEVIDLYKIRWNIEIYFMTLKSGLGLEKLKYRKLDRYLNATMFLLIVAWRVHCLTKSGRDEPEASCEKYFADAEWKSTWLVIHPRQPLPAQPPTMGEFMILVAILGGYVNRKQQGPPGVQTMWRGFRRVDTLAAAYRAFGPGSQQRNGL